MFGSFLQYIQIFASLLNFSQSDEDGWRQKLDKALKNPTAGQQYQILPSQNIDYALPAKVSLCGEAIDLSKRSVYERLEYEFLLAVNQPAQIALWQRRAETFFPFIEAELKKAGLPDDIKYLAVAESDLLPIVRSHANAVGIWQFIPATAKRFGLNVNDSMDQRRLPEVQIEAAKSYLTYLYKTFDSWALAMAAYNAGEGRIRRSMKSQGATSYYQLDLPTETERYVYRIAAIKIILEGLDEYKLKSKIPQSFYSPQRFKEKQIQFHEDTSWADAAKQQKISYKELRQLNPHILDSSLKGSYVLRLPASTSKKMAH